MTDKQPPLPPFDEAGHLITEPVITFTVNRSVAASVNEIYRAWTDPELFKRWIVPPGQELVSLSVEPNDSPEPMDMTVWRTTGSTEEEPVMYTLNPQIIKRNRYLEIEFYTSAVPGMTREQAIYLILGLDEKLRNGETTSTLYTLWLNYNCATLWRHTSQIGLNTFWLEATERLTRFVEQNSTLRETRNRSLNSAHAQLSAHLQ